MIRNMFGRKSRARRESDQGCSQDGEFTDSEVSGVTQQCESGSTHTETNLPLTCRRPSCTLMRMTTAAWPAAMQSYWKCSASELRTSGSCRGMNTSQF